MDGSSAHKLFARQNQGENRDTGSSVSQLLSTLIPVLIVATVIFIVFLIFRKKYRRVYEPRSYLDSLRNWQKSPEQSAGTLGWRKEYSQLKDEFVLGHASFDNYLWLRFFKTLIVICFVGCLITWPILFPVNATGGNASAQGLDILSFSHINPGPRYYAQVFVAWIFLGFVMLVITRESRYFIRLRQQYYSSPYESSKVSSKTVLFVNVPEEARNEEYLRKEYSLVKHVWLVNVPLGLAEKVDDRDKAAAKLETGEVKLIKKHVKRQLKKEKKGESTATQEGAPVNVDKKDRPMHRLPKLKFLPIGKKVDTIDWSRGELKRLIPEVAQEQGELRRTGANNAQAAVFIEFETVQAAHTAVQKADIKSKAKMTPKELGVAPQDIIWKNAIKPFKKTKSFSTLATTFVWLLTIFWAIPVAVVGAISNINYLTNKVPFLGFINDIPKPILGVVTGLLPVIMLAVLMALVPIIMTILAKLFEPTQGAVQMKVQGWYFPFQVIQVFLITTFASGAASVATQIVQTPQQAPALLAQNLPKASNFYIGYFILFGLNTAAMQFLNVVPLLFVLFLGKILDTTPRKMYNRYVNLAGLGWGALYPKFTNLGVIALSYSCISPLVLGFAAIGFTLLYFGFRYNALFTLGTNVSTRGQSYLRALQQLTVGIYLSEVCLLGLFAIGVGENRQSIGPLVLMIIFLVATILWHIWMKRGLKKLENDFVESPIRGSSVPLATNGDPEKAEALNGKAAETHPDGYAGKLPAPEPNANKSLMERVKGFFNPDGAANNAIWSITPHLSTPVRAYTQKEHDDAYIHPAISSETPMVWLARDKYGLSKQEVRDSTKEVGEGLDITDEGAWFNEKGKIEWKEDDLRSVPIFEDKPAY